MIEIAYLDFSSTDLVILSACRSGAGQAVANEGVYGLRRAFLLAGAGAVVSALWDLPDPATARIVASSGAGRRQEVAAGLREGQLQELVRLRRIGLTDHPYQWAALMATNLPRGRHD